MAEAGRKILRFHFAHMLNHEKGTRLGEDIEELHDMRVATRRMRAAFDVFSPFFKKKAVRNHLKGLRATGRALGRVRDMDVFIEKAQKYVETLPKAQRPGLEPLLTAWGQEQAREREKLLAHDFTAPPDTGAWLDSKTDPQPDLVRHVVPVLIYTNLAAVRAYEAILPSATIEQLHALRIEFKKFRYTLEFFREVLGKQSREVIDDLKIIQDHLGNLNDANVACLMLREFIDNWEDRQVLLPLHDRQNPEPVLAYLAAKHAERHTLMITFPQVWAHFNRPELREKLALAVATL
jgi:CHAD domain-containing protein